MPADPWREMGKFAVVAGLALVVVGVLLSLGPKLPFRLGRLPGDIVHKGEHFTLYFPLATSIVVSLVLTLLLWLWKHRP